MVKRIMEKLRNLKFRVYLLIHGKRIQREIDKDEIEFKKLKEECDALFEDIEKFIEDDEREQEEYNKNYEALCKESEEKETEIRKKIYDPRYRNFED